MWIELGAIHGLSKAAETAWLAQGTNARPSRPVGDAPWEHCAWVECLCYEQRALYKLSACKGCGRTFYCGKRCQQG